MNHAIEFVETSIFAEQIKKLASDDELKDLQAELISQPNKGDLIQGTGGLRKVRMRLGNKGKSGSIRVLYVLAHANKIFLVLAYPKSEKDDLTNDEKSRLKKLVQLLKGEEQ